MPFPVVRAIVFASLVAASVVFSQDDAALYYRRTHGGALPTAGVNSSDHSAETVDAFPAPTTIDLNRSKVLLEGGVDPANLGKGDWIWQLSSCMSALGVSSVQGVID